MTTTRKTTRMTVQTGREAATTTAGTAAATAAAGTAAAPMAEAEPAVRTFDNEDSLPRVPLPGLEDSCARFLDWCAPLLTAEQLAATEAAVDDFLAPDGPGRPLHA